jgi:choloylglycine hydrolase
MDEIDFSDNSPVLILNMDIKEGGDVLNKFHSYTNRKMRDFTEKFVFPILPEEAFTRGGITSDEYLERTSTHTDAAALTDNQFFKGVWKSKPEKTKEQTDVVVTLDTKNDAILGRISFPQGADTWHELEHLQLIGNKFRFTFRIENRILREGYIIEGNAVIEKDTMKMDLVGIEESLGSFTLIKRD